MSHPLTANRRKGTVLSISAGPPPRVELNIGADTTVSAFVPYLDSYWPTVGDDVVAFENQGDYIVVGRPVASSPPYMFGSWAGNAFTAAANLGMTNTLVDPSGSWDTTNKLFTFPAAGLYAVSFLFRYSATHTVSVCYLRINGVDHPNGETSPTDSGIPGAGPQLHGVFGFAAGDTLAFRVSVAGTGDTSNGNYVTIARVGRGT